MVWEGTQALGWFGISLVILMDREQLAYDELLLLVRVLLASLFGQILLLLRV